MIRRFDGMLMRFRRPCIEYTHTHIDAAYAATHNGHETISLIRRLLEYFEYFQACCCSYSSVCNIRNVFPIYAYVCVCRNESNLYHDDLHNDEPMA